MPRGVRLDPKHDERTRAKIKTSQIINRLQSNVFAAEEVMTSGQIRSAEILLKKTLPDLSAVEISGNDDKDPVNVGGSALNLLASFLNDRSSKPGG